jgi:hypothetical protein
MSDLPYWDELDETDWTDLGPAIPSMGNMRNVKVNKAEVLQVIKANREKHRELFLKAQEGFRALVIEDLDQMLADARGGRVIRITISPDLTDQPVDRTADYDTAIRMLEMSVDDVVELDHRNFEELVLDKWSWSEHAFLSNSKYSTAR